MRGDYTIYAVIISLTIHLSLLFFLPHFFPKADQKYQAKEASIVFRPKAKEKPQNLSEKPVVILPKQENEPKRPEKADFLAEQNSVAEEQSKAKASSLRPESLSSRALEVKAPKERENIPQKRPGKISNNQVEKAPVLKDGPSIDDFLAKNNDESNANDDPYGIKAEPEGLFFGQASPFSDQLEGIKEGDETSLNAWQWQHAPFFNRVKSAVAQIWDPNTQINRYDPQGQLLGRQNRTTVVTVTIDKSGNLSELKLAGSSGVAYLDEEAQRTFKLAAPFPFPPKELFTNKELFTFNFAFHLNINRGLSFNFDWGSN